MKKFLMLAVALAAIWCTSCSDEEKNENIPNEQNSNEDEKEFGQGETDTWDGGSDISWYTANPDLPIFEICSAQQLAGFAELVNAGATFLDKTIHLKVNIKLNEEIQFDDNYEVTNASTLKKWIPIGNESHPFLGSFDGKNHIISGIYVENVQYAGLFGFLGQDKRSVNTKCLIQNLAIIQSYIHGSFAGGVVGRTIGNASEWDDAECHSIISHCYNNSIIKGYTCGGIAGAIGMYGIISKSFNKGYIENNEINYKLLINNQSQAAGGILGQCERVPLKGVTAGHIEYCYNTGTVVGDNSGGIAGFVGEQYSLPGTITCCYNTGNIKGNLVGGIAGRGENATFCYNTGTLQGSRTGGIIGYSDGTDGYISNCYSICQAETDHCGGIIGQCYTSITNCYHITLLSQPKKEKEYIYGICEKGKADITNCYCYCNNLKKIYGSGITATFTDNNGKLTPHGSKEIIDGATILLDALNAAAPDEWTAIPDKNDGYPILVRLK